LPRAEKPAEVIVTTESRTDATTLVSSGTAEDPALIATAAGAPADDDGAVLEGASGPLTRAAVPPAARTADSRAAATTDVAPRDRDRVGMAGRLGAGLGMAGPAAGVIGPVGMAAGPEVAGRPGQAAGSPEVAATPEVCGRPGQAAAAASAADAPVEPGAATGVGRTGVRSVAGCDPAPCGVNGSGGTPSS
jgi:hypothetical protein